MTWQEDFIVVQRTCELRDKGWNLVMSEVSNGDLLLFRARTS